MSFIPLLCLIENPVTDTFYFGGNPEIVLEDEPINFGVKSSWLAVNSPDQNKLAKSLKIKDSKQTNWKLGFDKLKQWNKQYIFLTPLINDWILVRGFPFSDSLEFKELELIKRISQEFNECQLFSTHSVAQFQQWCKARNGQIVRLFTCFGDEERILHNEGDLTDAEVKLDIVNESIPDEDYVFQIAQNWSVNPMKLESEYKINGLALIGRI